MMYTYRHVAGYSALDHLAAEIIHHAKQHTPAPRTKRQAAAGLRAALARIQARMGPRTWPRIDVVRAAR